MPKSKKSSTTRRHELFNFIDSNGSVLDMVRKCSQCRQSGRVCKVHIRSGKCASCVRRNISECDVRVTENEFSRLRRERERLRKAMESARTEAVMAQQRVVEAQAEANRSLSKEMRLRKQLDALETKEGEAISVEERNIELQEQQENGLETLLPNFPPKDPGPDLALNPLTWNALEGTTDDFWNGFLNNVGGTGVASSSN